MFASVEIGSERFGQRAMPGLEPAFPIEFLVRGTPVSAQASRASSRAEWKERVRAASAAVLPEGHFAMSGPVSVTLFYFPAGRMAGDIDNIIGLTLDAMNRRIYMDDAQVERVVAQKFEPGNIFGFTKPSSLLSRALNDVKPLVYIRVSDRPFEDLV